MLFGLNKTGWEGRHRSNGERSRGDREFEPQRGGDGTIEQWGGYGDCLPDCPRVTLSTLSALPASPQCYRHIHPSPPTGGRTADREPTEPDNIHSLSSFQHSSNQVLKTCAYALYGVLNPIRSRSSALTTISSGPRFTQAFRRKNTP
jgi:hypothetical protein